MKTIAILFAVLLVACVDEPTPAPMTVYPGATYCIAHLDSVEPSTGFGAGPCMTTATIEMLCTQHDEEHQAFDDMLVSWQVTKPESGYGLVGVTYRCNQAQTVTIFGTQCTGTPFTVVAGFHHPVTGESNTDQGTYLCAEAKAL